VGKSTINACLHAAGATLSEFASEFKQQSLSKMTKAVTVKAVVSFVVSPQVISMQSASSQTVPGSVRSVDRELLLVMRAGDLMSVGDLTAALQVTATAVRQRVDRLLEQGYLEREKVVAGRGRPTFRYRITDQGQRVTAADSTDLAEAMWRELLAIEDPELRDLMLNRVAKRLGREYASQLDDSAPLEERMRVLSQLLSSRRVSSDVVSAGELPVLDISACPYPTLVEEAGDHPMCRLEEMVLSEALGKPVQLSQCRLDGDSCCQFAPTSSAAAEESGS
jgi:predicted ArsR family transcriptional regulator